MTARYSRREAIKTLAAASAAAVLPRIVLADSSLQVAGRPVEIQLTSVSPHAFRLTITPLERGHAGAVSSDGSLVRSDWGTPAATIQQSSSVSPVKCGELNVSVGTKPLTFTIGDAKHALIQRFTVDQQSGVVSFVTGDAPLLGLGEGGPQFDRR